MKDALFLGSKDDVLSTLRRLTSIQPESEPLRIAVAFWGEGAQAVFASGVQYQIICNMTAGGTNPKVIRTILGMPNVQIRHLPDLHAKVVAADKSAIVGSANFSADGLGVGPQKKAGWIEAAAVIDSTDVKLWFRSQWQRALPISEKILVNAERKWINDMQSHADAETTDVPSDDMQPSPSLSELELFKPTITGGNMIRMSAKHIEQLYFEAIEPESKRSVWNPAYAASIIWTAAGNRIKTRIEHCQYFETPADVLVRAKHAKTIDKVQRFLAVLSTHPSVSPAVRYWASKYLHNAT